MYRGLTTLTPYLALTYRCRGAYPAPAPNPNERVRRQTHSRRSALPHTQESAPRAQSGQAAAAGCRGGGCYRGPACVQPARTPSRHRVAHLAHKRSQGNRSERRVGAAVGRAGGGGQHASASAAASTTHNQEVGAWVAQRARNRRPRRTRVWPHVRASARGSGAGWAKAPPAPPPWCCWTRW